MSNQGEHSPIALHAAFNWNTYNQYLAWSRKPGNVATEGARSYWKCSETRKKCPWSLSVLLFLLGNSSWYFQRRLRYNHRKVYVTVKLIKFRIRRNIFFKIWFNGKCAQASKRKTDAICLTELPIFLLVCTTKQTAQCQSVGDRLQKCVRLLIFRLVAEKIYFEVGKLNIWGSSPIEST